MPSIGTKQNNRLIRPARPSPLPCARGSGSSRLGLGALGKLGEKESERGEVQEAQRSTSRFV